MKRALYLFFMLTAATVSALAAPAGLKLFKADNPDIQYVGRVDFANPRAPRIWAPGVYITTRFKGSHCEILINDEAGGDNHNYLEIIIDGKNPYRIKLTEKENVIKVPNGLADTGHTIIICKDTESNIGYMDFIGLRCEELLPPPPKPKRKKEYFGDSIT